MLLKELKDGVLTLTLNRPEIHNAFNDSLIEEISKTFLDAGIDESVRLIVLTGSGRSFCAGADLNWMKSMVSYTEAENIADSRKLFNMFRVIDRCQKPVLGLINGHALGGGMGLLSVCDYALTHSRAKFGFTEVRLGLIPAVISSFCLKKIGENEARAWFLSGEKFNAKRALKMGIIHEVCDISDFERRCKELIESFLRAGPDAAVSAKRLIQNVLSINEEDVEDYTCRAIAEKRVSPEGQEGMAALLEKREPNWMDK